MPGEYSEYAICEDAEEQVSHLMQVCEEQRAELQRLRSGKAAADAEAATMCAEGEKLQGAYEEKLEELCDLEKKLAYLQARLDEKDQQLAQMGDVPELERAYNDVLRSNQVVLDDMRRTARERETMVSEDWRSAVALRLVPRKAPAPAAAAPVAALPATTAAPAALAQEVVMLKAVGEAKDKVIAAKDERIAELLRRVEAQKPQADGWSPCPGSLKLGDLSLQDLWTDPKVADSSRKLGLKGTPLSTRNTSPEQQKPRTSWCPGAENAPPTGSESKLRRPSLYGPTPKLTPRARAEAWTGGTATTNNTPGAAARTGPQRVRLR